MDKLFTSLLTKVLAFGAGCMIWFIFSTGNFTYITWAYEKVGITIIALMPLAGWSLWVALKSGDDSNVTLAYIGTTAQRIGLLGTVIGIVAATVSIGQNLSNGAAGAVTNALPAVGQALVSTAVGFVIAIICDFFRYLHTQPE